MSSADPRSPIPDATWAKLTGRLRALAARYLAGRPNGRALQPTSLVHEAWVRFLNEPGSRDTPADRVFAKVRRQMVFAIRDDAKRRGRAKRGGHARRLGSEVVDLAPDPRGDPNERLEDAVDFFVIRDRLAEFATKMAELLDLRRQGLAMGEIARRLQLPLRTVERLWSTLCRWIREEYRDDR
ncbi:MAG TPA: ECF-type sigma factor [Planctomycetota bacterium]|nr:ECF-type sigma factor [Planctomycetota bacterium]